MRAPKISYTRGRYLDISYTRAVDMLTGAGLFAASLAVVTWGMLAFGQESIPVPQVPLDSQTTIILALIAGIPSALTATAGLVLVLRRQAETHSLVNGRLTELLDAAKRGAFADGVASTQTDEARAKPRDTTRRR